MRGRGGGWWRGGGGRVRGHLGDLQRHVASLILQPATLVLQQRVQKVRTLKDHKQITCSDLSPLSVEAVCRQSRTLKNQPQKRKVRVHAARSPGRFSSVQKAATQIHSCSSSFEQSLHKAGNLKDHRSFFLSLSTVQKAATQIHRKEQGSAFPHLLSRVSTKPGT